MASRVESLVGARSVAKPLISTFHSFCVRLLRRDIETLQIGGKGYRKDFVIYDEADQQNVVKAAMRRLGIDDKQTDAAQRAGANFVGQEPHARSAGGLPRIGRSARPSASRTSTRFTGRSWPSRMRSTSTICCSTPCAC